MNYIAKMADIEEQAKGAWRKAKKIRPSFTRTFRYSCQSQLLQGKIKLQGVWQGRQFFWRANSDAFFPAGFARYEFAGRLTDRKLIGYKRYQMLIGFAVDRRGLDSEFQPLAMQTCPFILAGLGLNMETQRQNPMFPMVPVQPIRLAN